MSWLDTLLFGIKDILEAGVAKPARPKLNFVSGATVVDNAAQNRLDVTVSGSSPSSTTPAEVTNSAGAVGVGTTFARSDHVHAHGNRGGGSLHAVAVGGGTPTAGFMSGADKLALDAAVAALATGTPEATPNTLCSRDASARCAFGFVELVQTVDPGAHASRTRLVDASSGIFFVRRPSAGGLAIDQYAIGGLDPDTAFNVYAELASATGPRLQLDPTTAVVRIDNGATGLAVATGAACALTVDAACTSLTVGWVQDGSGAGAATTIAGQRGAAGAVGGDLILAGGLGGTGGTNSAGAVRVKLGVPVTGATAPLYLEREDGTKIFTMYEIGAGTSALYGGAAGGTNALTIRGASVGIESSSTLVALQPNTDLYLGHGSNRDIFHREVGTVVLTEHLDADGETRFRFANGPTAFLLDFADGAGATAAAVTIRAQKTTNAAGVGGAVGVFGGEGKTGGLASVRGGNGSGTDADGGHVEISGGSKTGAGKTGNVGLHASPGSWNAGEGIGFVRDRTATPTGNPTTGAYWWSESGQLTAREPNKTVDGFAYVSRRSTGTSRKRILIEDGAQVQVTTANQIIARIPAATFPAGNCLATVTVDVHGYDVTNNSHHRAFRKFAVRKTSGTLTVGAVDNPGTDEDTTGGVNSTFSAALDSGDPVFRVTQAKTDDLRWSCWIEVKVSEH